MLHRVITKLKRYFQIYKINKRCNCDISFYTDIDKLSTFEGRNVVYSRTSIIQSEIGYASYISSSCFFTRTKVGRYCSIASNVRIIAGNHPTSKFISTHPVFYTNKAFSGLSFKHKNSFDEFSFVDNDKKFICQIGNDVWIGEGVKIINGVKIGDGAIIAAGAVVCNNIPPYAIVGGVPAEIIKYRFKEDDIDYLLELKWWNKTESWIKKNINYFSNIEELMKFEVFDESI